MQHLTQRVKDKARSIGIDLVGITPIERLSGAPPGYRAEDYLPDVRNVIVLGLHIPDMSVETFDKSPSSYQLYGYALLNKELGRGAYYVTKLLEKEGHRTLPMVSAVYIKDNDLSTYFGEFSHRHAAVAAGLGTFGLSGLVITPEFGTRQRFTSIFTTAPLEPDEMLDEELCDHCETCINSCPMNALRLDKTRKCTLAGKDFEYAFVDKHGCFINIIGLGPESGGQFNFRPKKKGKSYSLFDIWWYRTRAQLTKPVVWQMQEESQSNFDWVDYCGKCLRVCKAPKTSQ
ncbi:MAG: 4Fe-4S binding protein [Chloroflexota bacterium]|nr:4Fe-4S binding protein [Chloroflexota bacterium]